MNELFYAFYFKGDGGSGVVRKSMLVGVISVFLSSKTNIIIITKINPTYNDWIGQTTTNNYY